MHRLERTSEIYENHPERNNHCRERRSPVRFAPPPSHTSLARQARGGYSCRRRPVGGALSSFAPPRSRKTPENIADREVQRRQAAIPAGEAALARGKSAIRAKNYTVAYQEFKTAIAYLPDAVVSGRAHDEAAEGVCKSGTVLAEARIAQGDYAGAEAILNEILTRYDPNCRKAQELLAHMRSRVTSTKRWTPASSIKSRK